MTNESIVPSTMEAVLLLGHGGLDQLEFRTDVPTPTPGSGDVLVRVGAAGVNNTDINTRVGWYSKAVTEDTSEGGSEGFGLSEDDAGSWNGEALGFPRIQGADVAGTIVAVGPGVDASRLGDRVLVRSMQASLDDDSSNIVTMGSELDGGFAQYCAVRSSEAFTINSELSDIELATFPCAASTAEGMLDRANVGPGDQVLITGASGGVGSAAIQLARRRSASVIAVASKAKLSQLEALGADQALDRSGSLVDAIGADAVDVVVDVVAGPTWPALLDVLRPHGRYVVSGAIAGPIVSLDVRTLYLKDQTLIGSTRQPRHVFENLVRAIESGDVRPIVADTYPLHDIAKAQERFLAKDFVGNLVLVPGDDVSGATGREDPTRP